MTSLNYAQPSLDESDKEALLRVLSSPVITRGPQVEALEKELAQEVEAPYCTAFCNGSMALLAACLALDLGPFDEVFIPDITFIATLNAPLFLNCSFKLIDVDEWGHLDLHKLKRQLRRRSRGRHVIFPMHYAGRACDIEALYDLLGPSDLIIEDAAHALGSRYKDGKKVGSCSYSQMTSFSFHAIKNIACAEGGAVTTHCPQLDQALKTIRNSGLDQHRCQRLSLNLHLSELHASLGLSQLKRLSSFAEKKQALVNVYRQELENVPQIKLLPRESDAYSHYHLFPVWLSDNVNKEALQVALQEQGIGTQVHYPPLHSQPHLKDFRLKDEQFPQACEFFKQELSLPFHNSLSEEDVRKVCQSLKTLLK